MGNPIGDAKRGRLERKRIGLSRRAPHRVGFCFMMMTGRGASCYAQAPLDHRMRVLAAVADKVSQRVIAERFCVSAGFGRWRALAKEHGAPAAKPSGGDRRSSRVETEANSIHLYLRETPDMTLIDLLAVLAACGHVFGFGTLRRSVARCWIN